MAVQSSGEFRREDAEVRLQSFRGQSFETALTRLLWMRSSGVARSKALMVRRRASAVSGRCSASPGEPRGPDARPAYIFPGCLKIETECFNAVVPAKAGTP